MSEVKPGLIYQQISKAMSDVEAIGKDRNNTGQGYKFRGIDDVYNSLHPILAKHGIFTTTTVMNMQREERPSRSGGIQTWSILTIHFRFYAADGSFVDSTIIGEGMDSGDKASNKAMAVAHKYALMQIFAIPTEDAKDPENENPEPAPKTAQAASKAKGGAKSPPKEEKSKDELPASTLDPWDYVIKYGKMKGKRLKDIGNAEELTKYCMTVDAYAREKNLMEDPAIVELFKFANAALDLNK